MARSGAVFTIIAKNYLAHARCLMDSVERFHPELARFVILVDRVDGQFDPERERFTIILSGSLDIPEEKWFHFKYTLVEACTAVKPYVIEHLFQKFGFDFVIYLDPDILVCADLDGILTGVGEHSLMLTPHLTVPVHDGKRPSELDILRSGVYNLGFLAMARNEEALRYLRWWKQRLYDHCVIDLPRGLFLDQRWADFAPCFISRLGVLLDPGYNVAYWNLHHREVLVDNDRFLVNGSPLRFFHFSGFDPDHPDRLSKHQTRFEIWELPAVQRLTEHYRKLLYAHGYGECRHWPYAYGCFNNGIRIPDLGRPLHHEYPEITQSISDPFSDEGYRAFVALWNEPLEKRTNGRPMITRLAYRLYRTRHDLQAAMPNVFNGDYRGFVRWLTSRTSGDHDLPDVFLAPFSTGVEAESDPHDEPEFGARASKQSPASMTYLAYQIYDKRPDLQAFFPDPCGEDATKYLVWLLSYGKRQYALSEAYVRTLRREWNAQLERLPSRWDRLRYRLLLKASDATAAASPLAARLIRVRFSLRAIFRPRKARASSGAAANSSKASGSPDHSLEVGLISSVAGAKHDQGKGR